MLVNKDSLEGRILYIQGHKKSEEQARRSFNSFVLNKFKNIKLVPGITPETLKIDKFPYELTKNGRLESFFKKNKKYLSKLSCVHNTLYFCIKVLEKNKPMLSAEHDCICIDSFESIEIEDFCFLNFDTALTKDCYDKGKYQKYEIISQPGINHFPKNYPLQCRYKSVYYKSVLPPGLAGYILTPSGAKKILEAVKLNGLEQCDFLINSSTLKLEYISPSICTYNPVNLKTSHGF